MGRNKGDIMTKWQKKMIKKLYPAEKWDYRTRYFGIAVIIICIAWAVFMVLR